MNNVSVLGKAIHVDGHTFRMVMTSEEDGYYGTYRTYDVFYNNKLIAQTSSIKMSYAKAYQYVQENKL
jgi:hypothetical protein